MIGVGSFQDTFQTRKQSFISAFSICMTFQNNFLTEYLRWLLLIVKQP